MPRVNIDTAALAAIRANAVKPFNHGGVRNPDGTYNIDISDDVLARLESHRKSGEDLSTTILRVINQSPDIMFGSYRKKNAVPTMIDAFYKSSFAKEAGGGWTSNAKWREAFTTARRFVLDDEMSTFLGELSAIAFVKKQKPAAIRTVEHLRLGARLPFPTTWVEYNLRNSMKRSHELLELPFDPSQSPAQEGWLLEQHPSIPTAIRAHILTMDPDNPDERGFRAWTLPFCYGWTVDTETVLPWRPIMFSDRGSHPSEVVSGVPGYITDRAAVTFSDMVTMPDVPSAIAGLIKEWAGCLRRIWAFLATIDDLPVELEEVRPSKGFIARGSYRKFLHHKTVTLTVPAKRYRTVARKALAIAHRRAHGVRGHWRKDWRRPLAALCEHEFIADEKHMTCTKCKGRKIWVDAYQTGTVLRGLTTHDYVVTHGDDDAHA